LFQISSFDESQEVVAVLSDFGISRVMSSSITLVPIGTLCFMPPEVINKKGHSKASDIFALGITMWMLITKQTSWKHLYPEIQDEGEIWSAVMRGDRPVVTKEFNIGYASAMQRCWSSNVKNRPTIEEMLSIVTANFPGTLLSLQLTSVLILFRARVLSHYNNVGSNGSDLERAVCARDIVFISA
jgi:serine/threonine protein kinase